MKRTIFLAGFILLSLSAMRSQVKVLSNGNVAIRSNNANYGRVQMDISEGDNTGFCIRDDVWNELKFKLTTSEFYTYLLTSCYYSWQNPIGIGFDNADGQEVDVKRMILTE